MGLEDRIKNLPNKYNVLRELEEHRVFELQANETKIWVNEMCDYYFGLTLSRENCIQLSELFAELAQMDEIEWPDQK